MSKKSAPLPLRPEPPRVENIVSDIENVQDDDVIYTAEVKKQIGKNR